MGFVGDVRPDHLDGHRDLELLVPGLIHRAHPADAEQSDDVVAGPEVLADDQRPRPVGQSLTALTVAWRSKCSRRRLRWRWRGGSRHPSPGGGPEERG